MPAFALLALLHFTVFSQYLLIRQDGALARHIIYDFEDSYHRFLVYMSDCVRAGSLPLWYPFGSAGSPLFANPQSQLWSPVTWLVGAVFGYGHHVAQRQLVLTVLVGGFGAYLLAHELWKSRAAAGFAGAGFMLTGAVVTNFQHWDIINGFALMPFLFWSLMRLRRSGWPGVPALAIVCNLLATAGYPGLNLMLVPWAAGAVALLWWRPDHGGRRGPVVPLLAALSLGLLLSSAHLLSVGAHLDTFTRSQALTVKEALLRGIVPSQWLGLIFPFMPRVGWPEGQSESLRGLYIGVVSLPLIALCLRRRAEPVVSLLAGSALVALLMSSGGYFFLRVTLHTVLPVFNLSRFPSVDSRALAALFLLILAAGGVRTLLDRPDVARPWLVRAYLVLAFAIPLGFVLLKLTLLEDLPPLHLNEIVAPAIAIQSLLLLAAATAVHRGATPGRARLALAVVFALDLGSGVHAVEPAFGAELSEEEWKARRAEYVQTFSPAAALQPRLVTTKVMAERGTAGYIAKRFYFSDYNPFQLRALQSLLERGFRGFLVHGKRVVALPPDQAAVWNEASFATIAQPVEYQIKRYLCDRVDYEVDVPARSLLVFNEVYFPGWQAWVNGQRTPILPVAGGLRGLIVEPGRHAIHTRLSPPVVWVGVAATALGWIVLIALTLGIWRSRRAARRAASSATPS